MRSSSRALAAAAVFLVTAPRCLGADATTALSNEQILAAARSSYDKREMMHKTVVLGVQNGARVITEYPCSDVCPEYTVRVIRYDVSLEACERAGGVVVPHQVVPRGIAVTTEEYCVPRVLVENGEAPEHESRGRQ